MANPTIAATVEASNVPPRVRLNITDTGTPAVSSVTVTRLDPSGRTETVRTSDGNPLTLTTSGTSRIGTLYDYEMPLGASVTYSTTQNPASTATATVSSVQSWLIDVGVPSRSMVIRIGEMTSRSRSVSRGVFQPLGRRNSVVVTDGARKGYEGTLSLVTVTDDERRQVEALIEQAGVVLFNPAAGSQWGLDAMHLSFGDVEESRVTRVLAHPARRWSLPYIQVDPPIGGSQAQWTYANITAQYATYTALMAGEPTYADVLAPTN